MICSVYDERNRNWVLYETAKPIDSSIEAIGNGFINLIDNLPGVPIGSKILGVSDDPEGVVCKPILSDCDESSESLFFWGIAFWALQKIFIPR